MTQRIIVVGAGVSGIAAAVELKHRGFDVTLLESNNYLGGKAKTLTKNGFVMEQGASILPSNYTHIIQRLRSLNLTHLLQPGGSIVGFARGEEIHCLDSARLGLNALTTRLISTRSKLVMLRMVWDNLRIKPMLSYEDGSRAAPIDTESAADYCHRRLNGELLEYIVDATLRGLLGTQAELNSVVDFFFSFNNVIGSKLFTLAGGMTTLPHALVKAAGLDVRLRVTVDEVIERNGRVTVAYSTVGGTRNEEVDGVVMALPACCAARLLPGFAEESLSFLRGVKYTKAVSVNLPLCSPPPNQPAFVVQIPKSVHPDLFGIVLDHNKAPSATPPGKGMASLYAMSKWSEQLLTMDDRTVVELTLAAAEQVMPGLANLVEFSNVNRWNQVIVYSEPGFYRALGRFVAGLEPTSRIKLAGDYFSCSNLNTAFAAGERAARQMDQTLRSA